MKSVLATRFIYEVKYTKWISNIILVNKASRKWRIYVCYTNLNKAYAKDSYPLTNIKKLVDNLFRYKLPSLMDGYSWYYHIPMFRPDTINTTFMIWKTNYQYNFMPFRLRNNGITYQKMMHKVFLEEIGKTLEVFMEDMIVKFNQEEIHDPHFQRVFKRVLQYNMRLNPKKNIPKLRVGKFLGFYLTKRGIKANPYKCKAMVQMGVPTSKKEV